MRRTFWISLLTLALALGTFSSGVRGAAMPMQGDCCETMCQDMAACAHMLICQACNAPTAALAAQRAVASVQRTPFPSPGNDKSPAGPIAKIWTPPD